ncbi:MAG TPA: chemotaxis protein CheA [Holophagaceae bacterium]|nr:chemotaxis protein CheA [Holophagaceae bacterium]
MVDILGQYRKVFFEEAGELLDAMEATLLRLDLASLEREDLNLLFRVAHSLKGNAATFGFPEVAAFTHELESGLEPVRQGDTPLTQEGVDLLLQAVDMVRSHLAIAQADQPLPPGDKARQEALAARFRALTLGGHAPIPATPAASQVLGWLGARIRFRAPGDTFRRGLNLERIFRDLRRLGPVEISLVPGGIPALTSLDPEACHLAWDLVLTAPVTREQVEEVFEFVDEGDNLHLEPLQVAASAPPPPAPVEAAAPLAAGPEPPAGDSPKRRAADRTEASTLRVSTEKIDRLLDLVGELVITQAMLAQSSQLLDTQAGQGRFQEAMQLLDRQTRDLQERVMGIRMVPVDMVFSRFPRLVRDLSKQLGKEVDLHLEGQATELDKTFIELLVDPLTHLVRNSLDHGIESKVDRVAAGKHPTGHILLRAYSKGGHIHIEVKDDGKGLDKARILAKAQERGLVPVGVTPTDDEIHQLIFEAGFSTAAVVSDLSGRGVGMDVVRQNIRNLGGRVEVESRPGEGSTFRLILPLTLAILDGLIVRLGQETYVFPLASVLESFRPKPGEIQTLKGDREVINLRGEFVPVLRLPQLLQTGVDDAETVPLLVVVEAENRRAAMAVEELLGQSQVVIKSLETHYRRVEGLSGATILGDGHVALILDVAGLLRLSGSPQPSPAGV